MTYKKLYEDALFKLEHNKITLGEFEEMIKPLEKEIEQEPNTWSLDDARENFMHDVYNTLDFLPTNNEANRIIDSFDRVTSGIKQEPILDKIDEIITDALDKSTDQKESQTLRWILDKISEVM